MSKKPRPAPAAHADGHGYLPEELAKYDALQADHADWCRRHDAAIAAQDRKTLAALAGECARLLRRWHALRKEYGREDPPPERRIEREYPAEERAAWIKDRRAWDQRCKAAQDAGDALGLAAARAEYKLLSERRLAFRRRYGSWDLDDEDPVPGDSVCAVRHACYKARDQLNILEREKRARLDLVLAELQRAADAVTDSGEGIVLPAAAHPAKTRVCDIRRAIQALLRWCDGFCGEVPSSRRSRPGAATTRRRIRPEHRTIPMSLKEAALLMGYTDRHGEKNGVAMLSDSIRRKAVAAEQHNRQQYVFDRQDFPKEVHPQIVPEAARNSP